MKVKHWTIHPIGYFLYAGVKEKWDHVVRERALQLDLVRKPQAQPHIVARIPQMFSTKVDRDHDGKNTHTHTHTHIYIHMHKSFFFTAEIGTMW